MRIFKNLIERLSKKKNQVLVFEELFRKSVSEQTKLIGKTEQRIQADIQLVTQVSNLVEEVRIQNKKLDNISDLVRLMSIFFDREMKAMEESESEPPPEPTKYDKMF